MLNENMLFKCPVCDTVVEILASWTMELECCGRAMNPFEPTPDSGSRHKPVVQKITGGLMVLVGDNTHPMQEDHFIQWIEVISSNQSCRAFFKPLDKPQAAFAVAGDDATVRICCSVHGMREVKVRGDKIVEESLADGYAVVGNAVV